MNFHFNEEEQEILDMLHDYAVKEVAPRAHEIDEEEKFPMEARNGLAEMGMMGMYFPEEYGGAGLSYLSYIAVCEELAVHCATTSVVLSAHESLCSWPIYKYGTEEQKQKYLVPLAKGEKIGAFGLTEPSAGTDSSMQQTTAVLDGDEYVLNGTKMFTTNSGFADTFIVFALTDKSKGPKGMSAFIVEREFEGLSVGPNIERMGIRAASNCEVIYENVKVPAENLLGKEGQGYKIAMTALGGGRIGIGAQSVGIAQGAIDETLKYVKERKQGGKPIGKYQNTQFKLAEMQTKTDAARLMVWRAATEKDLHGNYAPYAAMCKMFASETANEVTRMAVQLFGGYGYCREYPVERAMRDAKITEIYEGTSEVQMMVISGWMGVK